MPARLLQERQALEAEQKTLGDQLAGTAIYAGDAQVLAQTQARFSQLENELLEAMERWERLSSK